VDTVRGGGGGSGGRDGEEESEFPGEGVGAEGVHRRQGGGGRVRLER
jgi:hypothetical protein